MHVLACEGVSLNIVCSPRPCVISQNPGRMQSCPRLSVPSVQESRMFADTSLASERSVLTAAGGGHPLFEKLYNRAGGTSRITHDFFLGSVGGDRFCCSGTV